MAKSHFLAPQCLSVCLSTCISAAPTGRIFGKFYTGTFTKICCETPNLVKIGQQYWALYMKT